MALRVHVDETTCAALCQHPACWQSNTRQDKGFPRLRPRPPSPPDIELDLPTLKVCNMLEDYGDDPFDKYPARYGGKPAHQRKEFMSEYQNTRGCSGSMKMTRVPQPSPKSSSNHQVQSPVSAFKVVEVQEVFDPEDLQGTWDDTFVPKSYYIWVPNKKKKKRKSKVSKRDDKGKGGNWKDRLNKVRDLTESMVPKEIEDMRLTARKKRANQQHSSPVFMRPYTLSPRTTMASSKMEFDHEGYTSPRPAGYVSVQIPSRLSGWQTPGLPVTLSISELLDLPRDILVHVLENTRQSDLMSKEKIKEIIRRYQPSQFERGNTNISLASQDLLQQKKLNLHQGNKNIRQPQLMETKPVFYLDEDVIDDDELEDEDIQRPTSPYGSLKDLYFPEPGHVPELNRYKKPLPAISGGRAVSAGEITQQKIPSISLGLPELPSGIRQTKAFTYSRKADFDFTLGSSAGSSRRQISATSLKAPVPTPPTSVRSTATPAGSDHGTTIRVNVPSHTSPQSEHDTEERKGSISRHSADGLHVIFPTLSTRVPKAPATTPATNQVPLSPSKSAPPMLQETTGSMIINTSQEWPREQSSSPLQVTRAPVNTPGSMLTQDAAGLGTIPEMAPDDNGEQPHPMSRGRSVRFEIPEVPPPPSSPQLSEDGGQKDPSRNAVTVNTNIPQQTPSTSTKPMSGATVRTDANTVNTSTMVAENSFVRSQAPPPTRELSYISSPEPWPQINEADYEEAPVPSPITQESPGTLTTDPSRSDLKSDMDKLAASDRELTQVSGSEKEVENGKGKDYLKKDEAVKRLMEESMKAESPAPPPPSPEPKQDSSLTKKAGKTMTPLLEETETPNTVETEETEMTILQIAPLGPMPGAKKNYNRQIDTFQNIDIPASYFGQPDSSKSIPKAPEPFNETIMEEPEPELELDDENNANEQEETKEVALSVQSTLANRTISEQAQSDASSSMIEPAISQASQAPALSEDFSEWRENSELLGDWTGVVFGSEGQETMAMLSSDKQDMMEDGGDHEGFKEDLRQEYERLVEESENTETVAPDTDNTGNKTDDTLNDSKMSGGSYVKE